MYDLPIYNMNLGFDVTPSNGAWTEYVSEGMTLLRISSTKHKERPLRTDQAEIAFHALRNATTKASFLNLLAPKHHSLSAYEKELLAVIMALDRTVKKESKVFQNMKRLVEELPTLTTLVKGKELMVYLSTVGEAISAMLLAERMGRHIPVHYVSQSLQRAKINYAPIKELALALVHAAQRLRRYFQAHITKVIMDRPINQILNSLETSSRLAKLTVELGVYDISYLPRSLIKGDEDLEEIHVTWAHLGKTRTNLQLYIKVEEEKGTHTLETTSQSLVTTSEHQSDGITKIKTVSGLNRHSEALEDTVKRRHQDYKETPSRSLFYIYKLVFRVLRVELVGFISHYYSTIINSS
nr:reverse transcriptase domain-containing protein [Tanacetum cinerariifolium]